MAPTQLRLVVLGAVLGLAAACGSGGGKTVSSGDSAASSTVVGEVPSKVPNGIARLADRLAEARRAGTTDLSSLSDAFVHVRPDGSIELVLGSNGVVTAERLDQLRRAGAEPVAAGATTTAAPATGAEPSSVPVATSVGAWVHYDRLDEVAALPWVVSITAPSYARAGG